MIKGLFFDLDGTLVETHEANYRAYKRALADSGIVIDFEAFKKTIGHQFSNFIGDLAPDLDPSRYSEVASRKAAYYKEYLHLSKLNESLVKFMRQMSEHQKIVLVTTAKKDNAMAVLEHHELTDVFDFIITAQDVEHSKPAPDAYLLALKKAGLDANEVIAFEDSEVGCISAGAAGIAAVQINDFSI